MQKNYHYPDSLHEKLRFLANQSVDGNITKLMTILLNYGCDSLSALDVMKIDRRMQDEEK